jgi:hypothetical protein
MIWRRWVTESSSSVPQTSSDHLDRRLSNTRMRPPQSGLVQVGLQKLISHLASILGGLRATLKYPKVRFADNSEVFIGASRRNGKNQLDR